MLFCCFKSFCKYVNRKDSEIGNLSETCYRICQPPRRQSGGILHKELAKLDNNYSAKERFAALASRRRLGNHRAAVIMAAAIGAQSQDAASPAAMQLALAAVPIRNATANFIPAHRLIRFGTRDINYELMNFSCLRMGSYAELVRIHAALDIDDG